MRGSAEVRRIAIERLSRLKTAGEFPAPIYRATLRARISLTRALQYSRYSVLMIAHMTIPPVRTPEAGRGVFRDDVVRSRKWLRSGLATFTTPRAAGPYLASLSMALVPACRAAGGSARSN